MKKILAFVLGYLLFPVIVLAATPPSMDMNGLKAAVAQNKGQVVVVNIFATWCPPCRLELPYFAKFSKQYAGKVAFIGLSVDQDKSVLPAFIEKMGITYPVYMAADDIVSHFGVRSIPHNIIYDKDGKIQANQPGIIDEETLKAFIDTLLEHK